MLLHKFIQQRVKFQAVGHGMTPVTEIKSSNKTNNIFLYSIEMDLNKSKQTFLLKLHFSNQATKEWNLETPSFLLPGERLLAYCVLVWAAFEGP